MRATSVTPMSRFRSLILTVLVFALGTANAHAQDVDAFIEAEMEKTQVPGVAVAVVKSGEIVKASGYGLANVELNVPVTPNTVFPLGGLSRLFKATAIMLLVEQGKVGLDDRITKYFINAPHRWREITVRHLLTNTSGLKNNFWPMYDGSELAYTTTAHAFEHASTLPLEFVPGERWQYSELDTFLLAMIVEQVSGKRYREFVTERIFEPLGMTATYVPGSGDIVKNRAGGYYFRDGKLARWGGGEAELYEQAWSTVTDLAKFDAALYTDRLLKKTSLEQMWTSLTLNNGRRHGWGFQWRLEEFRGHRVVRRCGATGVCMFRLPDDELTVIVLTNLSMGSGSRPLPLVRGVAAHYLPSIRLSAREGQPDPDPQRTRRMRNALSDIAAGVTNSPLLTPEFNARLNPMYRRYIAGRAMLEDVESFTFLACEDVRERQIHRHGIRVSRICHYKLVDPIETRYLSFYLTADGAVAGVSWSPL